MPRLRVGVVLLVPPPADVEIDALRRAVGDGTLGRVPAHLTLVPPVNVREDRLDDALRVLREAGARHRPFRVSLGPPASFLPDSPVLYLPVVEGEEAVLRLREGVFRDPLARSLTWPYVPHVTIADEAEPGRIAAARAALAGYAAELTFERVHLLQETQGRVWTPFADASLAAPSVIGRGGLPTELSVTARPDPEARALLDREGPAPVGAGRAEPFAVTARREGRVVGSAHGWTGGGMAEVEVVVVAAAERGQGIGSHVLAAVESLAAERGCSRLSARVPGGSSGEGFLRHRGWVEETRLAPWVDGSDLVVLRRDLG